MTGRKLAKIETVFCLRHVTAAGFMHFMIAIGLGVTVYIGLIHEIMFFSNINGADMSMLKNFL